MKHLNGIFVDIREELEYAINKFPPFYSGHEGYAIILEELDELWELVKGVKDSRVMPEESYNECIQIASGY